MNIHRLQQILPWTVKYSRDFKANTQDHKDFAHAITHAMKALGKLSSIVDDKDHRRVSEIEPEKYIADLVICALRMANTYPDKDINLEACIINRIETKNNIELKLAQL